SCRRLLRKSIFAGLPTAARSTAMPAMASPIREYMHLIYAHIRIMSSVDGRPLICFHLQLVTRIGSAREWLEWLPEGTQIDLVRPGGAVLAMDLPIGFRDGLDAEQAVGTAFLQEAGRSAQQSLTRDAAVDHGVRDVDALRSIFPRHALRDRAQARLGGREM